MSLIYDYLKIHGESGSDKDSDVEIPPTLKRRDTNRFNTQALPLILGSCLIGALFIFLIIKIITPDQSVQVASESGQVPVAQTRQMPAKSLSPTPETELALLQEKTVSDVVATSKLPEELKENLELYSGCISGAATIDELKAMLKNAGFENIQITPDEKSKAFLDSNLKGTGIESKVVSLSIEAVSHKIY